MEDNNPHLEIMKHAYFIYTTHSRRSPDASARIFSPSYIGRIRRIESGCDEGACDAARSLRILQKYRIIYRLRQYLREVAHMMDVCLLHCGDFHDAWPLYCRAAAVRLVTSSGCA